MGTQLPHPKKVHSPHFSADVYSGQTAGWIKMPLGTKVGLGPGHIVLHGDSRPPLQRKGAHTPIFGPCLLWPNGCKDQDETWHGDRPRSRPHYVRWGPTPPKRGHIVLDGALLPQKRGTAVFGPCLLWRNGRPSQLLLSSCLFFALGV